jgi:hypothetical protein
MPCSAMQPDDVLVTWHGAHQCSAAARLAEQSAVPRGTATAACRHNHSGHARRSHPSSQTLKPAHPSDGPTELEATGQIAKANNCLGPVRRRVRIPFKDYVNTIDFASTRVIAIFNTALRILVVRCCSGCGQSLGFSWISGFGSPLMGLDDPGSGSTTFRPQVIHTATWYVSTLY